MLDEAESFPQFRNSVYLSARRRLEFGGPTCSTFLALSCALFSGTISELVSAYSDFILVQIGSRFLLPGMSHRMLSRPSTTVRGLDGRTSATPPREAIARSKKSWKKWKGSPKNNR